MKAMMLEALDYLEHAPYANRIISYQINGGHTVMKWLGWGSAQSRKRMTDFSPAAQKAFASFARQHYPELKNVAIPSLAERQIRPVATLQNGQSMGTLTTPVAPMFVVTDPGAKALDAYENGASEIAALKTRNAVSVFPDIWSLDVPFLAELARQADVFIYADGSLLEANSAVVCLHARFSGKKIIRLP